MATVVLDTNALLMPFQFNIDLVNELQRLLGAIDIHVPEICLYELENIRDRKASVALEFAQQFKIEPSVGRGDDAVLALAGELRAVLVTNDADLRRRAKTAGLKVAYLRGRDHLVLE